jgi:hypothetical protein
MLDETETMDETHLPHLTEYEKRQIEVINAWLNRPPSLTKQTIGRVGTAVDRVARRVLPDRTVEKVIEHLRPAGSAVRKVIPTGAIESAIEGALHANMWLARHSIDERSVLRKLEAKDFKDLNYCDLEHLDRAAGKVHDWAIADAGVAGGAFGAGGIFASTVGIAAIINMSLRTIRKIGLCYGYANMDELEKAFIFTILGLGGADQAGKQAIFQAEKLALVRALQEIGVMVSRQTFKRMAEKAARNVTSKEALVITAREVAKALGYRLTKNRILMSVPLIGGGVGLLVDGNYIRNIGWAATYSYKQRWLGDKILRPTIAHC